MRALAVPKPDPPDLAAWLAHAEAGRRLFPCIADGPNRGAPDVPKGSELGRVATTDPARIHSWFKVGHRAFGWWLPEDRAVVDLDSGHENGADGRATLKSRDLSLPATARASTPRGGEHHIYSTDKRLCCKNGLFVPESGVDVKTVGGYILIPPSPHREWLVPLSEQNVAPAPAWLEQELLRLLRLRTANATSVEPFEWKGDREELALRARAYLEEILPAVEGSNGDTHTFRTAASLVRDFALTDEEAFALLTGPGGENFDEPSWNERCSPPWSPADLREKIANARKYGQHPVGALVGQPGGAAPATAADTYPTTEAGDAEFFAARNAAGVRYDHRAKRWLVFRGHYWAEQTTGDVHRLALDAIRARLSAAAEITDKDERKRRVGWALSGEARKRLVNQLALAENIIPIADAGDSWDTDPGLLGVQNGVIDLRTGALRPGQPSDGITLVSPLCYDPGAPQGPWRKFVLDIADGNQEIADHLQVTFGYALTGEVGEECFWIFYGEGANGRSTLLETMTRHVIPHHSWTMAFPAASWSDAMGEYQRAQLVGRRLIVTRENERRKRLHTEFVKSLTGCDTIQGRHPYGRSFNFAPVAKFILAVNHKPIIVDETHGMWRRVRLLPFFRKFPVDPAFAKRLVAEAPGALAWAVQGAVRYYTAGLTTPQLVQDATAAYRVEEDQLAPFFAERCALGPELRTPAQQALNALRAWYDHHQVAPAERLSHIEFSRRIAADPRFVVAHGTGTERRTVFYNGLAVVGQ